MNCNLCNKLSRNYTKCGELLLGSDEKFSCPFKHEVNKKCEKVLCRNCIIKENNKFDLESTTECSETEDDYRVEFDSKGRKIECKKCKTTDKSKFTECDICKKYICNQGNKRPHYGNRINYIHRCKVKSCQKNICDRCRYSYDDIGNFLVETDYCNQCGLEICNKHEGIIIYVVDENREISVEACIKCIGLSERETEIYSLKKHMYSEKLDPYLIPDLANIVIKYLITKPVEFI